MGSDKHLEHTPSSLISSNPVVNTDRRKKKKKIQSQTLTTDLDNNNNSAVEWKSDAQQQIYSSKLLRALRQVRLNGGGSSSAAPKRVREAAERVLAATAKGQSKWSRAILTNRIKLKFMKKHSIVKRERNVMTVITRGKSRRKSKVSVMLLKSKGLQAVQRKGRVLGRLVPGCRKQPLPVVLDEATDYIAALDMQVRAMSALAELLSGSGSSSSDSSSLNQLSTSGTPPSKYGYPVYPSCYSFSSYSMTVILM